MSKSREDEWPKLAEIERKVELPADDGFIEDDFTAPMLGKLVRLVWRMGYVQGLRDGSN